jgi:hypothetical protein
VQLKQILLLDSDIIHRKYPEEGIYAALSLYLEMKVALFLFAAIAAAIPITATTTIAAYADNTRMTWRTVIDEDELEALANSVLDSGDLIIFNLGRDPTAAELQALDDVRTVPDSRKGLQFFSLAMIREHAPAIRAQGLGIVSYDLEASYSPDSEVSNPTAAFREARRIADQHGLQLAATPSRVIAQGSHGDDIAKLVHRFHLQAQALQDNDSTCTTLRNWVADTVAFLERHNPNLQGRITYQVSLTDHAASGKTIYQTAIDCIRRTSSSTGVDGAGSWWGTTEYNNGQYERLLRYHESNFS